MTNLASVLKTEISRVARKEARTETLQLKKASAQHRTELASLKRRVASLERQVKGLLKTAGKGASVPKEDAQLSEFRYTVRGFKALNRRLGMTPVQMGALLGASDQSVKKWLTGNAQPRGKNMSAIAAIRDLNKKQAFDLLNTRTA